MVSGFLPDNKTQMPDADPRCQEQPLPSLTSLIMIHMIHLFHEVLIIMQTQLKS